MLQTSVLQVLATTVAVVVGVGVCQKRNSFAVEGGILRTA